MKIRTKISPPWIIHMRKLEAMFEHDEQVSITYDNDTYTIKLLVDDAAKAAALARILPEEVAFGNVTLKISVIPANGAELDLDTPMAVSEAFDAAFAGNPVYAFSHKVETMYGFAMTYIVFKNRVVQFFADNLRDLHGNISTLYQDIAEDIFRGGISVAYCTDIEEKVGAPLGEWP